MQQTTKINLKIPLRKHHLEVRVLAAHVVSAKRSTMSKKTSNPKPPNIIKKPDPPPMPPKKAGEKSAGKRLGKVYISSEYVVDLDNKYMVDEAKECMLEDLLNAVKFDELPSWINVAEDDNLSEADIPEFLIGDDEIGDECVEITAGEYEWECPHCEILNKEIEITENVTCSKCHKRFFVYDHHHAYGNR